MSGIEIGAQVPNFKLASTGGKTVSLSDLQGKTIVLYFYPKDDTPGCTLEGQDFRDHAADFQKLNAVVLGVSRDNVSSHEKFKDKYELNFDLLADEDETLCNMFDVIKEKNMYGKQVRGIERSTFLVDNQGVLRQAWRKVKVEGHVTAVIDAVKQLS